MPKKLTIELMHEEAKKRNGECLSNEYVHNRHKLTWKCQKGHVWSTTPFAVRGGQWCPTCGIEVVAEARRIRFEDIKRLVESKNGEIISERGVYLDTASILHFRCGNGHDWNTKVVNVWHDRWCPICQREVARKKTSHSLDYMKRAAESKGGRCLSTEYINVGSSLRWQCSQGHTWEREGRAILKGQWCPICFRDTIEDLHRHAKSKFGECLSEKFTVTTEKYAWRCENGHEWNSSWHSVKKGSWCIQCVGNAKKTLEEVRDLAKKKGGKLLSNEYINRRLPLMWECADGHQFTSSYMAVSANQWCSKCNYFVGEEIVRAVFEEMFKVSFPKDRPTWLRHKSALELDGYNEQLQLAFEHHGMQHYKYKKIFHRNGKSDFEAQKKRDKIKRQLCHDHNVTLIEIPEFGTMTKSIQELEAYIIAEVGDKKHEIDEAYNLSKISLDTIHYYIEKNINILQSYAKKRGGKLSSKQYLGSNHKLEWECELGHVFNMSASAVKNAGQWCPLCGIDRSAKNRRTNTIDDFKKIAEEKGGKCLSEEYTNIDKKLDWECSLGHRWSAVAYDVKKGHWCPVCANNIKLTIPHLKELAEQRGGRLLSTHYVNSSTKLHWRCSEGHEFMMHASAVKSAGQWCPTCGLKKRASSRRGTIEEMQAIAFSLGGKCLSSKYISSINKLKWECKEGHQWESRPDKIKQGRWCLQCKRKKLPYL